MKYLSVRNFDRLQHYKKRRPPWVKFYVDLLDDYELTSLPWEAQFLYDRLILCAAKTDNRIPDDEAWIAQTTRLQRAFVARHLPTLVSSGFLEKSLQTSSIVLATGDSQTETETEKSPNGLLRNEIWDALTVEFGIAATESARSLRGKIVRSLLNAGATPGQIAKARKRWNAEMPTGATFTETALEKHWGMLVKGMTDPAVPCPSCGVGGGLHLADCVPTRRGSTTRVSPRES